MMAGSQEQVRTPLETRSQAFRHRDAATAAAPYGEQLVLFNAVGPFVRRREARLIGWSNGSTWRAPANARGSQREDVRDGSPRPQACATAKGDCDA